MRKIHFFITMSLLVAICACSTGKHDARLDMVDRLAAESPRSAMDSLAAIDRDILSEADSHYYDLLSVKCADKAYITHTSDTLILSVIDWYAGHKDVHLYPEALYYGGRVYSDLGDYPTALKYFQDALCVDGVNRDMEVYGNILSQTGRLLNKIRLYNEAIPYLERVLRIDSIRNDTFDLAYDYQLIGTAYFDLNRFQEADINYSKAQAYASKISPTDSANMTIFMAATKMAVGETDSALSLIRRLPENVAPSFRNICLAYATEIYLKSGVLDTAYNYALELANSDDFNNRKSGYSNLLSEELMRMIPIDSLPEIMIQYRDVLEKSYDMHGSQLAIIQNSLYNYQLHEKARLVAENNQKRLMIICSVALLFVLVMIVLFLLYRIKLRQTIIKLNNTLELLNSLEEGKKSNCQDSKDIYQSFVTDVKSIRTQLDKKIIQIESENNPIPVDHKVINSHAYEELQCMIANNVFLRDSDPLWDKLEKLIYSVSPNFQTKLHNLIGLNLKRHELQTIILIKCGVTPTHIANLLQVSKSCVTSRRESLGIKIFGEKKSLWIVDNIIRAL